MTVQQLETKLDETFNKKAPQLPASVKRFLVDWAPWLVLVGGIFSVFSGIGLWSAARGVHYSDYYYNQLCSTFQNGDGTCTLPRDTSHLSFWLWLAAAALIIQGILYVRAYARLRDHLKSGWNLLFYAELVYVAYAIATLLTGFDVADHFLSAAIGIIVTFYLLFQIRPLYLNGGKVAAITYPVEPTTTAESTTEPADAKEKKDEAEVATPEVVVIAPIEPSNVALATPVEVIEPAVTPEAEVPKQTSTAKKPVKKAGTKKPAGKPKAKRKPRKTTPKKP